MPPTACALLAAILTTAETLALAPAALPNPFPWESPMHNWSAEVNVTNVKAFGACGDGVCDDTDAILAAWNSTPAGNFRLYFPCGTYKVSRMLYPPDWNPYSSQDAKRRILQGQSTTCATILLADGSAQFQDPYNPQPMMWIGWNLNSNFGLSVISLTLDVGLNNPGAEALRFDANNEGSLRNLSLVDRSGGGAAVGLEIGAEPGPMLVKYVAVSGFRTGWLVGGTDASITAEHLWLSGQAAAGIATVNQILFIKGLVSNNSVPAFVQTGNNGMTTLVDAFLSTPAPDAGPLLPAAGIDVAAGIVWMRNVVSHGYEHAARIFACNRTGFCNITVAPGPYVSLLSSLPPITWADLPAAALDGDDAAWSQSSLAPLLPRAVTLNLTAPETPEPPPDADTAGWVNILGDCLPSNRAKGAPTPYNCTDQIAASLAGGGSTLFFPAGAPDSNNDPEWIVNGTLVIPETVTRIIGHVTDLNGGPRGGGSTWVVAGGTAASSPLWLEYLNGMYSVVEWASCMRVRAHWC